MIYNAAMVWRLFTKFQVNTSKFFYFIFFGAGGSFWGGTEGREVMGQNCNSIHAKLKKIDLRPAQLRTL